MPRSTTIEITKDLLCPCCHQLTRRQWMQPSWNPNKPSMSQTDCLNPQCAGYYRTLSIESFWEQFADSTDNSYSQGNE